jgi:PIN domain nuclease of toxin-antitoxin system
MKLLLDTHAFLWFVGGREDLSEAASRAILDGDNLLFLSPASYWEMCIKISIGKLVLADGWSRLFEREMRRNGIRWLEMTAEHFRGTIDLPFHHRDPFDRLLVSQAVHERCSIVTADPWIPRYRVKTIW